MKRQGNRVTSLILSLLLLVGLVGQAAAADPLLDALPGNCMFCVRINDLSGSLAKLDQYLVGVSPIGTAMMVNMQLAGIVGDPMLTGIDMNGTFAVLGLSDFTQGFLVPVTGYDEFITNNPNCTQTADGYAVLSPPNEGMGKFALMKAMGGKYAIVVPDANKDGLPALKAALENPSNSLASRLTADQAKESAAAPAWAYINLTALYEQFSPMVTMQMEQAQAGMTEAMGPGMGEFGAFYVKMYMELFEQFAGQADSATLALNPEPTNLNIDMALKAKDGSELAKMMVPDPDAKKAFAYTGYMNNSNAMNGLMKWDSTSMTRFYGTIFDIMEKSMTEQTPGGDSIKKMRDITNRWMPLMGDEIAFSFSYTAGPPPFVFQEVIAVKDKQKVQQLMTETMDIVDELYAAMGIKLEFDYKPNVSTYKGASIDKMTFTFPKSDDPNDPMVDFLGAMYGDSLEYVTAITDDTYYITMGPDSEKTIKQLIDQPASAAPTGEVKAAFDLFKGTPYNEFIASVNLIKLVTGLGQMMQSMGPAMAQMQGQQQTPMPPFNLFSDLNLQTQSSLAFGAYSTDGQVRMRTVLPKQHLMELMSMGMQIQQKMMPMGQPAPDAAP